MSTRKVYGVYDTTVSKGAATIMAAKTTEFYTSLTAALCNAYTASVGKDRDGKAVAVFTTSGARKALINPNSPAQQTSSTRITDYAYAVVRVYAEATVPDSTPYTSVSYLLETTPDSGAYWHSIGSRSYVDIWTNNSSSTADESAFPFHVTGGKLQKGNSLLRTETTSSSLTEGAFMQGNDYRWRTFRGADTIDPTAVTYSTNDLYPNEPVTITVTPVTPTYGGTIYYQYQYSTNGGSTWTNLGSRTTDTSKTMTIPEGATQFRARVTASDGWGFTSTTPVLGANLGVSQLKAFATINALHRSGVKMYATVDGKIREITKGYATVDGVIRKMF